MHSGSSSGIAIVDARAWCASGAAAPVEQAPAAPDRTGGDGDVGSLPADVVGSARVHAAPGRRGFGGIRAAGTSRSPGRAARELAKAAFDRSAAAFGLLVLAPLLLAIAILVRLTSAGPALYVQTRVGRGGRRFRMVKFRSMIADADSQRLVLIDANEVDGPLFKIRADPRVTGLGRFLRRFSLDELPQLFNVLTGSMSLVGPRPPLPEEVSTYSAATRRRLLVKPGITGLWQVSGRSDLTWEESVRLDLDYVDNWSLRTDLVLLIKTARVVVRATGAY